MKAIKPKALKPWQHEDKQGRNRKKRFPEEYAEQSRKLFRELINKGQ